MLTEEPFDFGLQNGIRKNKAAGDLLCLAMFVKLSRGTRFEIQGLTGRWRLGQDL